MSGATKSPRTSPKFLKAHQQQPTSFRAHDGSCLVNNCNKSTTHHSITVSSQPASSNQQQQKEQQQKCASQLSHVVVSCENSINNNTGIKQGPLNGKSHAIFNRRKVDKLKVGLRGRVQSRKHEKSVRSRTNSKLMHKEKFVAMRQSIKSRAKIQNVIVEPVSFATRCAPEVQSRNHLDLDVTIFYVPPLSPLHHLESENINMLSRDDRLIQKKIQLRHRVEQFKGIRRYRTTERSRIRFRQTLKLLNHLDRAKEEMLVDDKTIKVYSIHEFIFPVSFKRPYKSCQFEECTKEAMYATLHCTDHILLADKEQHLIRQCSFLYECNEQCRVPVLDVMTTIAVCNQHQDAVSFFLVVICFSTKSNFE